MAICPGLQVLGACRPRRRDQFLLGLCPGGPGRASWQDRRCITPKPSVHIIGRRDAADPSVNMETLTVSAPAALCLLLGGYLTRNGEICAPENKEEADHFKFSWLTSVVILLVTKQDGAVPFASKNGGQ